MNQEENALESSRIQNKNTQFMDLEERQRIIKDRLTLISQNLIDQKEKNEEEILEIKKNLEKLNSKVERLSEFIETISEEFSKFAKKEDLDILKKQAKIFQPLDFVKRSELDKLKNKENQV